MGDDVFNQRKNLHIGLIPDGNRRFARKHGLPVWEGHRVGARRIEEFTRWCVKHPEIKNVSIFALSTDNLGRSEREVKELWDIYETELLRMVDDPIIKENGVRVRIVGDSGLWTPGVRETVNDLINSTKNYSKNMLNILLAYGSKFEISSTVKKMTGKPKGMIDRFLFVKEPLNLVIRTGGQQRLSNFMLYQASYANILFEKKLWPEVTKKDFSRWVRWYYTQENKFGV